MRRDHWTEDASCDGADVNDFYPEGLGRMGYEPQEKRATALCTGCPVQAECLEDALRIEKPGDAYGVRGGLTSSQRKAILKKRAAA